MNNHAIDFDYSRDVLYLPNGYIETVQGDWLSFYELQQIYELEKDMWSHWLGEYLKCNNCAQIFSKEEVFSDISNSLRYKTVSQIERVLNISTPYKCICCWWENEYIFWSNYVQDISSRYEFNPSFLCVFRDTHNNIKWFIDGYISSIDTIYMREFENYYSSFWKAKIIEQIESNLSYSFPEKFLCVTALWVHQEYSSMLIIYSLMKKFFEDVMLYDPHICGIYESVLWTNTHSIYEICWWKRINIPYNEIAENTRSDFTWDIFIHENISQSFIEKFWDSLKNFMKWNLVDMKKILENNV